jgi:hypothetical protein
MITFVGERRSNKAVRMGVRWADGRLAACTLFAALRAAGVKPETCRFVNAFERGTREKLEKTRSPIVVMGRLAQAKVRSWGIHFTPMVHPAARGRIRKRVLYQAHVREVLRTCAG